MDPSETPPPNPPSTPPPSYEDPHPKDPQAVRFFADLIRACDDPIDKEILRVFRNETKDFQAAINQFAMQKAHEASERYNTAQTVMEEEEKKIKKKKEEEQVEPGGDVGREEVEEEEHREAVDEGDSREEGTD